MGSLVYFQVRDIARITDRNIDDANHVILYLCKVSASGRTCLNNNLGSNYSKKSSLNFNPTQQATSSSDFNAYGYLYQRGRYSDGHALITWFNSTTGTPTTNSVTATQSTTDKVGNAIFVTGGVANQDWR
jgi:hypothetical protein